MKPTIKLETGERTTERHRATRRITPVTDLSAQLQAPLGVILSAAEILDSYFDRLTPQQRAAALQDILGGVRDMIHLTDSGVK